MGSSSSPRRQGCDEKPTCVWRYCLAPLFGGGVRLDATVLVGMGHSYACWATGGAADGVRAPTT